MNTPANTPALSAGQALDKLKQILDGADTKIGIALSGELGAGKTHFVRELARMLDPEAAGQVSSPTYAYRHQYSVAGRELHHYDLYRVRDGAILESIGFWESLETPRAIVLVEWAELFPETMDYLDYRVVVSGAGDACRTYALISKQQSKR